MSIREADRHKNNSGGEQVRIYQSPVRLLLIISFSIFVIEAAIMMLFTFVPALSSGSPFEHALLDSTLLILTLSPVLYYFLLSPLILHIEERRAAEENLKGERDRIQKYLDIAGVMLVVLDRDGRVGLINKKGCEILGWNEGEISGKDWFDNFLPEGTRDEVRAGFREIISGNKEFMSYFENPVLTRSGGERMILWHNTALTEDGRVTGTLSSGEDITERKRAEAALLESEKRYRLINKAAFDGIIIADKDDRITEINPSAENIFGYSNGELNGMKVTELMPEKYRARHLEGLRRYISTGISAVLDKVLEFEGLRKNGEVFPIELVVSGLTIAGEMNFTGTIRDITERKRAERERDQIQARLNQAQKMEAIGRFAGGIAHDFNNILTTIRGNAEVALEDVGLSSPAYSRIEGIILSVLHASRLTRQLLLFGKGQPFERVRLNINSTIENLMMMITRIIGEEITISTDLVPDPWTVMADEGNIEQVIMNLAVNARDAMPGGGTLSISTRNAVIDEAQRQNMPEARAGRAVCITVSDTGVGMEKEVVQRIFEPFYTTKELGKGIGFGLSVVYGIIKQHGGWITVQSARGKGSAFRVFLPALPVKAVEKEPRSYLRLQGGGERILIAEGDPSFRQFAKTALSENGYTVFDASNAKDAIKTLEKEGGFSLVFTDIVLPDRTGLQLIEELISRSPGFSVLLTGSLMEMKPQSALLSGKGFRYLQKPYSLTGLLRAVSISIEQSRIKQ